MGVLRPDLMMKCIVPVVMAGIIAVRSSRPDPRASSPPSLALPCSPPPSSPPSGIKENFALTGVWLAQIYGLVVSVLISGDLKSPMALYTGFIQLGAGLSVGLAGLSAGFAIGIVGDAGVRGVAQQVRILAGCRLGGAPTATTVAARNASSDRRRECAGS
jgi:V-type H+-transporting ATPase proteolipid subunit